MNDRIFTLTMLLGSLVLFSSCNKQGKESARQMPALTQGSSPSAIAGIRWQVPERWQVQPQRQMRIATYVVPAATKDVEAGECAVFYFGSGEGGDVESNITRWIGQFEGANKPVRSTRVIDGLKVSLINLSGTYRSAGGPMMASGEKKEGYRLVGAIVEAPMGLVFFKLTGPEAVVASAEGEFNGLVESVGHNQ